MAGDLGEDSDGGKKSPLSERIPNNQEDDSETMLSRKKLKTVFELEHGSDDNSKSGKSITKYHRRRTGSAKGQDDKLVSQKSKSDKGAEFDDDTSAKASLNRSLDNILDECNRAYRRSKSIGISAQKKCGGLRAGSVWGDIGELSRSITGTGGAKDSKPLNREETLKKLALTMISKDGSRKSGGPKNYSCF